MSTRRAATLLWAALLIGACGCAAHDGKRATQREAQQAAQRAARDSALRHALRQSVRPGAYGSGTTAIDAVELGAFTDSASAAALRDSLMRAGWLPYVRHHSGGSLWRVRVARGDGTSPVFARVIVAAMRRWGQWGRAREAAVVSDTVADALLTPLAVAPLEVGRGVRGMSGRVRWALSPDSSRMVARIDWSAAENDPAPDGVALVTRGHGAPVLVDSVWDAEPSPDFRQLAVGRAWVLRANGRDSVAGEQWDSLAHWASLPARDLRAGSFPASGMSVMRGVAQLGVVREGTGVPRYFPIAAGWRVGWSADGRRILASAPPSGRVDDGAAPSRWLAVDATTGTPAGELPPGAAPAPVPWVRGPLIDASAQPDTSPRTLGLGGSRVESHGGWVRRGGRIVGPGVALAATRDGRAILALVPRPDAAAHGPPLMLAIYWVS